tara:strand:+ start:1817 stop:1981 length:165 start_codon:yes stop_codon:yes gene_type:complete
MKINTKVVFEWNPESKQYEEIYCDSYDYDGDVSAYEKKYPGEISSYKKAIMGGL